MASKEIVYDPSDEIGTTISKLPKLQWRHNWDEWDRAIRAALAELDDADEWLDEEYINPSSNEFTNSPLNERWRKRRMDAWFIVRYTLADEILWPLEERGWDRPKDLREMNPHTLYRDVKHCMFDTPEPVVVVPDIVFGDGDWDLGIIGRR